LHWVHDLRNCLQTSSDKACTELVNIYP
jgi:hypothetical protein